jgi:hypothetical protein
MCKYINVYQFTVAINISKSDREQLVFEAFAQANKGFFDHLEKENGVKMQTVAKEGSIKAMRNRLTKLKKDEGFI